MRKIVYPADMERLRKEYLAIFSGLDKMQKRWEALWKKYDALRNHFPRSIRRILVSPYRRLVWYYSLYCSKVKLNPADEEELKKIFNYSTDSDKLQPTIALFFMQHAIELNITVCNYCETAYINMYSSIGPQNDSEQAILEFINRAPKDELSRWLGINSDRSMNQIILQRGIRPFSSKKEFNNFGRNNNFWRLPDKIADAYSKHIHNHFDIDHALDKGRCPLLALSLMNFVPSCQVCNEKIKHTQVLGINNKPSIKMSPTSDRFTFDRDVTVKMTPLPGSGPIDPAFALDHYDSYTVEFETTDPVYREFIKIFRLRQRYQFHKAEGLYWLSVKERYNDVSIAMMANAMNSPEYTTDRIREDIFRANYDTIRHPCFAKMKKDILNNP